MKRKLLESAERVAGRMNAIEKGKETNYEEYGDMIIAVSSLRDWVIKEKIDMALWITRNIFEITHSQLTDLSVRTFISIHSQPDYEEYSDSISWM